MLSRIIGENIELITELEEDLWSIRIDPVQVEQIILNLVINARDAMPDGGRLIVKTENKHFTEYDCVALEKARPGDFACLSVQDTGVGIKREHMDHIFEPFFSTKENGKGTGLGLSVIYATSARTHRRSVPSWRRRRRALPGPGRCEPVPVDAQAGSRGRTACRTTAGPRPARTVSAGQNRETVGRQTPRRTRMTVAVDHARTRTSCRRG